MYVYVFSLFLIDGLFLRGFQERKRPIKAFEDTAVGQRCFAERLRASQAPDLIQAFRRARGQQMITRVSGAKKRFLFRRGFCKTIPHLRTNVCAPFFKESHFLPMGFWGRKLAGGREAEVKIIKKRTCRKWSDAPVRERTDFRISTPSRQRSPSHQTTSSHPKIVFVFLCLVQCSMCMTVYYNYDLFCFFFHSFFSP